MKKQKSTFVSDYPPWPIDAKPKAAEPPRPAGVLNEDHQHYRMTASETKREYDRKALAARDQGADPDRLRATNFKMDGDDRLKTFETTQKSDYTRKQGDGGIWALNKRNNPQKSCLPQGDPEKADMPVSDYRARYVEHDLGLHAAKKAENRHRGKSTVMEMLTIIICNLYDE